MPDTFNTPIGYAAIPSAGLTSTRIPFIASDGRTLDDDPGLTWNDTLKALSVSGNSAGVSVSVTNSSTTANALFGCYAAGGSYFEFFTAGSARAGSSFGVALAGAIEVAGEPLSNGMRFGTYNSEPVIFGTNNAERMRIPGTAPGAAQAALLVQVNDGATTSVRQVTVGAADSGGAGFRYLRVPN